MAIFIIKCHYAECRYAECRGAITDAGKQVLVYVVKKMTQP